MKKTSGIGAIILALAGPVIGLIDRKKRDAPTPTGAGVVRDIGTVIGGLGAGSAIATQAGAIDWQAYGLEPSQVVWINLITCITGAVLYLTGIGKTAPAKPEKPE
jgi:hypothetical protein